MCVYVGRASPDTYRAWESQKTVRFFINMMNSENSFITIEWNLLNLSLNLCINFLKPNLSISV